MLRKPRRAHDIHDRSRDAGHVHLPRLVALASVLIEIATRRPLTLISILDRNRVGCADLSCLTTSGTLPDGCIALRCSKAYHCVAAVSRTRCVISPTSCVSVYARMAGHAPTLDTASQTVSARAAPGGSVALSFGSVTCARLRRAACCVELHLVDARPGNVCDGCLANINVDAGLLRCMAAQSRRERTPIRAPAMRDARGTLSAAVRMGYKPACR